MSDHRIDEIQIVVSAEVKEALEELGEVQDKVEKIGSAKGTKNKQLESIVADSEKASKKLGEVEKALDRTGEKSRVKVNVGEGTKQFEDMKKGLGGVADKAEQTAQQINKAFSLDEAKKLAGNLSQTEIAQQKLNNAVKQYKKLRADKNTPKDKLENQKLKINQLRVAYERLIQQQEKSAERQAKLLEKEAQAQERLREKQRLASEKATAKKLQEVEKATQAQLKALDKETKAQLKATEKQTQARLKAMQREEQTRLKAEAKMQKEMAKEQKRFQAIRDAVEKEERFKLKDASVDTKMAKNLVDTTTKADTLRMKLDEATETVRRLMVEGTGGSKLASAIENVKKAQADLNAELERPSIERQERRMARFKTVAKAVATVMKKLGSATATVGKAVGRPLIAGLLTPFTQVSRAVKSASNEVGRLFKNLKRVALYRALREMIRMVTEGIKTGVSNAYQWALAMEEAFGTGKESATRFRASMDSLATSSLYLKNSLGAMAMPLLNILAPAVDYMIDKFVALLNIINKLIATVSGASTWTRALKYPKAFGEALDDASGSAGKLKDELITILGIDEINPMADAKDPSGRGGGAGAIADDYGAMFEEVALESDRIDDILSALFDPFKQAWETKGKGVMEAFDNALNGIKASALAVGTSFWEVWTNGTGQQSIEHLLGTLEGVLNTIGNIGKAFAKGWNTDNIGTKVVQNLWDALNSILGMWETITQNISSWNFDFSGVFGGLETVTRGIKESIDAVATSFSTVFSSRAEGSFQTILGIFEGIERVLGNIALQFAKGWNTNNLGTKIFENIWKMADNILNSIKEIVDITVEWASGVNFEPILSAFESLTGAVEPFVDLVMGGLKWAWENVLLPLGKWTFEKGLPTAIETVATIIDTLRVALENIQPFAQWVWDNFLQPLISWTADIAIDSLKGLADALNDVKEALDGTKSWEDTVVSLGEKIQNFLYKRMMDLTIVTLEAAKAMAYLFGHDDIMAELDRAIEEARALKGQGLYGENPNAKPTYVLDPTGNTEFGKTVDPSSLFKVPVIAEAHSLESAIPEGEAKISDVTAEAGTLADEITGEKNVGGVTAGASYLKDEILTPKKVDGVTANATTLTDGIKGNKLIDGVSAVAKAMTDKIPTKEKLVSGVEAKTNKLTDGIATASKVISGVGANATKLIDGISASAKVVKNVSAQFGTTDPSKLSASAKAISTVAKFTNASLNWSNKVQTYGKAPMFNSVANFAGLQTNWNSKVATYGKAPMWGAVANFMGLQTNWNSKISTYGKAPMWGAVANFLGLQTNWNSNVQTSGKAPMWNAVANFIKKATGWESGTTTWGSTANFTQKTTGWKSGTTTWNAVANFLSALTGWDKDTTVWEALAQFTDWSNALSSTPTIKATAKITKFTSDKNTPIEVGGTIKGYVAEMGGSFYNGSWHNIPQYASGGLPNHGSMFIAGEAGAELVGHIGGHTEVLNQSQMASALAEGMAPQAQLLQQLVAIGEQILAEQGDRNVVVSTSAITEGFQRMNRREGRTVVPVGV